MAIQYSVTLRNNQLDQIESTLGTAAKLQLRTGAAPANCGTADSGTLLAEFTLPSDWMAAASAGSKVLANGPWSTTAAAAGTAAHYRVKDNAGTTTHMQGTVTATGGGGDMVIDNPTFTLGQTIQVTTFTVNAANA